MPQNEKQPSDVETSDGETRTGDMRWVELRDRLYDKLSITKDDKVRIWQVVTALRALGYRLSLPVNTRDGWGWQEGEPVITDEEFERLTGGKRTAAIDCAIGAASMCWDPIPTGVFDSTRAAAIGADLARYLNIEPNMSAEEGSWLLVLLEHAIPRDADGPNNWENGGRQHAEKILRRIAQGGASDLEKRHMALIEALRNANRNPVDSGWVLDMLGEPS